MTALSIGLDRADEVSGGNSELRNVAMMKMFGLGSKQESAALYKFGRNKVARSDLEKTIGKDLGAIEAAKIPVYAEIASGTDGERTAIFERMRKDMSKEDAEAGVKLSGTALKEFLYKQVDKGITDPGLEAQKTSVELLNKVAESMTDLVGIETKAKEGILGIWKHFEPNAQGAPTAASIAGNAVINALPGGASAIGLGQKIYKSLKPMFDGGDNRSKLYAGLMKDLGINGAQASGIVGNLAHETGGFRFLQEKGVAKGRGGFGWAQ